MSADNQPTAGTSASDPNAMAASYSHTTESPPVGTKGNKRQARLMVLIVFTWVVTAVVIYFEREHWFGEPRANPAVLQRSTDTD